MIQVTCQQCSTRLELDNAFAGGVCRCRHCGHLQKVPRDATILPDAPTTTSSAPRRGSPTTLIIVITGIVVLAAAGAYFLLH